MDLIDRGFPRAESLPKGFDGHVDSNFVPVLEAIGHGLRSPVYMEWNSLGLVRLDSFTESAAREPHDPEGGRCNSRFVGLEVDCYPDFVRILRRQAVEPKCRQKANDTAGNEFRGDSQTVMFCDGRSGESVDAAGRANQQPFTIEAKQGFPGDPASFHVARTDERLVNCEFENSFCGRLCHVSFRR